MLYFLAAPSPRGEAGEKGHRGPPDGRHPGKQVTVLTYECAAELKLESIDPRVVHGTDAAEIVDAKPRLSIVPKLVPVQIYIECRDGFRDILVFEASGCRIEKTADFGLRIAHQEVGDHQAVVKIKQEEICIREIAFGK